MKEVSRKWFTLVFLGADENDTQLELTYNWDADVPYSCDENFWHVAYSVENIYEFLKLWKKV